MLNLKKLNKEGLEAFAVNLSSYWSFTDSKKQSKSSIYREALYAYEGLTPEGERCNDYVYPVIRKRVNGTQALVEQTLLEGKDAVALRHRKGTITPEVAEAVNQHINDVVMRKNDGYNAFSKAYQDILLHGTGFIKTYLEENVESVEATIEEWVNVEKAVFITVSGEYITYEDAMTKYPHTDFTVLETKEKTVKKEVPAKVHDEGEPETVSYQVLQVKGDVVLTNISRDEKVDYVPFQEIFVDPNAQVSNVQDLNYVCHRMNKTRAEVLEMFPEQEELVYNINGTNSAVDYPLSAKEIGTGGQLTDGNEELNQFEPENEQVHLLEHYVYSSNLYEGKGKRKNKDKKRKLYQVYTGSTITSETILGICEVSFIPLAHGVGMKRNTSFYGRSYYEMFRQDQELGTEIMRNQRAASQSSAFRRYTAIKGQYDRKALLDNRPGGVVETTAVGAITPMIYHPLDPTTETLFAKLEASSADDEQRAIGNDLMDKASSNAKAGTTQLQVQSAEMGPKQICRTIGDTLHKEVMKNVYKLLKQEDVVITAELKIPKKIKDLLTQQGVKIPETVDIPASALPKVCEFEIDINTVADESRQMVSAVNTITTLSQLSETIINDEKLYNLGKTALDTVGLYDTDNYLVNPADAPPPSPQQQAVAQAQMEAALKTQQAQAGIVEAEFELKVNEAAKSSMEMAHYEEDRKHQMEMDEHNVSIKYKEIEIKEKELAITATLEQQELALKEEKLTIEAANAVSQLNATDGV